MFCKPNQTLTTLIGVGQNAQGVFEGVIKGVTRALLGRRVPQTPQLKRASARRREEKDCRGVYMIFQVAAERLGWGQAPSLDTRKHMSGKHGCHLVYFGEIEGANWGVVRAFRLPNGASEHLLQWLQAFKQPNAASFGRLDDWSTGG